MHAVGSLYSPGHVSVITPSLPSRNRPLAERRLPSANLIWQEARSRPLPPCTSRGPAAGQATGPPVCQHDRVPSLEDPARRFQGCLRITL